MKRTTCVVPLFSSCQYAPENTGHSLDQGFLGSLPQADATPEGRQGLSGRQILVLAGAKEPEPVDQPEVRASQVDVSFTHLFRGR